MVPSAAECPKVPPEAGQGYNALISELFFEVKRLKERESRAMTLKRVVKGYMNNVYESQIVHECLRDFDALNSSDLGSGNPSQKSRDFSINNDETYAKDEEAGMYRLASQLYGSRSNSKENNSVKSPSDSYWSSSKEKSPSDSHQSTSPGLTLELVKKEVLHVGDWHAGESEKLSPDHSQQGPHYNSRRPIPVGSMEALKQNFEGNSSPRIPKVLQARRCALLKMIVSGVYADA